MSIEVCVVVVLKKQQSRESTYESLSPADDPLSHISSPSQPEKLRPILPTPTAS